MTKQKLPDSNLVVFVLASNLHCLRVIVIDGEICHLGVASAELKNLPKIFFDSHLNLWLNNISTIVTQPHGMCGNLIIERGVK